MKKIYVILCITIASLTQLLAQAPQGFNYQATVRNSAGDLIVNTNVYFKFNVIQGSQTAVPIFTEIHYVLTDDLGQISLVIGQGTATEGTFSELDWSLGSYYLGIELDTGNGYVAMGTTQLLSVPYALYAENSGNSTPTTPNLQSVLAENNSANNQQIKNLQDPTDAQDAVTLAYITQLETSLQDLQNQLEEQNQNIDNDFDGLTENNGDCDDTNAQVYTDAEEICDGLDNNCNGLVDENIGSIFYQDLDGDGFGGSTTIQSCEQPQEYSSQGGDCDDSDASIYPGTIEIEGDGIDNNCDGDIDDLNDDYCLPFSAIVYGTQEWSVVNACNITYLDGTLIPKVQDDTEWESLSTGAWCYYNNDPTKPRLYNWFAIMGIHDEASLTDESLRKEFAPEGWHVPTYEEWTVLQNYLIANGYNYDGTATGNKIAKAMASTTGWNSTTTTGTPGTNQSLNNDSGFNAFPGGRAWSGDFTPTGWDAYFWSSTENNEDMVYSLYLSDYSVLLHSYAAVKQFGRFVRFVRD